MTGIRNRFLRGRGGVFRVIEAPRGHPFGGGQVLSGAGLVLPGITGIVEFSQETLRFQQIAKHLFSE